MRIETSWLVNCFELYFKKVGNTAWNLIAILYQMYAHNFVIFRVVVLCQVAYKKAPFEIGWTIFFCCR